MNIPRLTRPTESEAREARLARHVVARLTDQADRLPHDIAERLRAAREQAVHRARRVQTSPVPVGVAGAHGAAVLGAPPPWWLRIASLMPLLLLVVGLMLIEKLHEHEQILAAADVDVALLADELPPAAYSDPGFLEFLKQPEP